MLASTAKPLFNVAFLVLHAIIHCTASVFPCGGVTYNLGRHFKAPKKSDIAQWKKVAYLVHHGFYFQKIRPIKNSYCNVSYPSTLAEAKVFVKKYKKHALI